MEFSYRGFSAQMQHNQQLYRTPSSSSPNYANVSVQGGLWNGRSMGGESEFLRELERKRIREEILAEEERKRILEAEIRREVMMEQEIRGMYRGGGSLPSSSSIMLGHPYNYNDQFQPQLPHGQAYPPVDRRTAMPLIQEDYGVIGRQRGEHVGLDVVPLQQPPKIKEIITLRPKAVDTGIIGFGKPNVPTMSGTKRKQPSPPVTGSTDVSKSSKTELSCALCKVSATSERGLQDHMAGKKHQAKAAELKANPTGKTGKLVIKNIPQNVQMGSNEDKKAKGECSREKFKFWCRMCRFGASDKKEMNMHKKGTTHLRNQLNRAQKSQRKTRRGGRKM